MSRTVYIATLPNGETVKRTTESRHYTHVVVSPRSYEGAVEAACRRDLTQMDHKNGVYYLQIANAEIGAPHPCGRGIVKAGEPERAREHLAGATSALEYADNRRKARLGNHNRRK